MNGFYSPHQGAVSARFSSSFFGVYLIAVLVVILSFIYLDIPNYVYFLNSGILPKYFYFIFFALIAPLLLLKPRSLLLYLVSPFALWALAFIVINSADLVQLPDSSEYIASLISTRNQFVILSLFLGFAFSSTLAKSYEGVFPVLAIIIPLLVILDFMNVGALFPSNGGRAAAMFINPNRAGEAMLLTCLLAIPVLRLKSRIPFFLLVGAGILLTFSRGAIFAWILFGIFLLVTRTIPKKGLIITLITIVVLPFLWGSFEDYLMGRQDIAGGLNNILLRLDFSNAHALDDNSSVTRLMVLKEGWELFLLNPFFGAGSGATSLGSLGIGTHNQIVMLAAEHGLLGIGLWVWLAVILWKGQYFHDKRFQILAVVGFIFLSLFSHNMFDNIYWLLTFALVSGQRRD